MKNCTVSIALLALVSGCLYDQSNSGQTFGWARVDKGGDTVSIFSSLVFAFSEPIADTAVPVVFEPAFYGFYSSLNASRDTVTVALVGQIAFAPSTRYVLRRAAVCKTANGATLYPQNDSLVFYTHAAEQEPNNSKATADSLVHFMDGTIETAIDTDCFILPRTTQKITLIQLDSGLGIALNIYDSLGACFVAAFSAVALQNFLPDTITIPDSLHAPFYCALYSQGHSSGDRYILGAIRP
ncbi:MAG: hypothetical protein PHC61_03240 [Chitinivibrionales bacterium]|nr:hypothetical protein [Chitinivibrionales bacterium]